MPRLLAPMKADSFSRTSNPSLRGSKSSLERLKLGSNSTSSSSRQLSFRKNYSNSKGSQFSLARRSSMQKQRSGLSSTSSLRRQKSSRQNSLLSYMQMEEPTKHNAEWNFMQTQQPKQNAFWNIVNQESVPSRGPPSLVSSEGSASTDHSSQASLQCPGLAVPPTSLNSPMDDSKNDFLRKFVIHQATINHQSGTQVVSPGYSSNKPSLQHPTILHPINNIQRSRRNSSSIPQIKEEDAWGHFVETVDAKQEHGQRSKLSRMRKHPASFSHFVSPHEE